MCVVQDIVKLVENNYFLAALALIGAGVVASYAYEIAILLLDTLILPGKSLKKYGAGKGAWAIVTGASDGIGKEYSLQLAKAKFNVMILARTQSKLDELAETIKSKYGVQVKVIPFDFAKATEENFTELKGIIDTLDIGILVNNVGLSHEFPTPFHEEKMQRIDDIIKLNITTALKLTHMVAEHMVKQRRGLIINQGSISGVTPSPYLSVYSGSKAFLCTWSQALGAELSSHGVDVEHVNTYYVVSSMSKIRRPNFMTPLPAPYVRSVLGKLGLRGGARTPYSSSPYFSHALVNYVLERVFWKSFWLNYNKKFLYSIRKRALRKQERDAAKGKSE
ncbi:uncharacterized protein VTP21DRAFT_8270 [Calcarisporiella thermophila]|uniref:uncharacterized protein n=1 Tax=Calcarisporiella thermophila TaxID=911321 RepID=UPI003743D827